MAHATSIIRTRRAEHRCMPPALQTRCVRNALSINFSFSSIVLLLSVAQVEALRMLLRHRADVNAPSGTGETPLMMAARLNRVACVEELLALSSLSSNGEQGAGGDVRPWRGLQLDAVDERGKTALHHACQVRLKLCFEKFCFGVTMWFTFKICRHHQ